MKTTKIIIIFVKILCTKYTKSMRRKLTDMVGKRYQSTQGCWFTIVEYFNNANSTIKFDNGITVKNVAFDTIKKGNIKNRLHPSVYGVGFEGIGEYSHETHPKAYKKWKNFQNFAPWFYENYKPEYMEGWQIDKDILFKGNKIYSSKTCCFVPQEINSLVKGVSKKTDLPIGVRKEGKKFRAQCCMNGERWLSSLFNIHEEAFYAYKPVKEAEIQRLANKYRGQITEQCYQALMNYQVEIDD